MASTPAGTVDNISIGQGIVYMGDSGVTPVDDQGYLAADAITLSVQTEIIAPTVGFPRVPIRQFVASVTATLTFTSMEWKFDLMNRPLQGTLTQTATEEEILAGVDACPDEVSIRVQFCMPCVDDTITLDFWRAQSDGNLEISLGNDNEHRFGYTFTVLLATEKWDATPLPPNEGLFRIYREIAP